EKTLRMGRTATTPVTFSNDGTEPVHVILAEQGRGFTAMSGEHQDTAPGAPKKVVEARTSVAAIPSRTKQGPVFGSDARTGKVLTLYGEKVSLRQDSAAGDAWSPIADYPMPVMDNAMAYHDGKVYVLGGQENAPPHFAQYSAVHVYDPA